MSESFYQHFNFEIEQSEFCVTNVSNIEHAYPIILKQIFRQYTTTHIRQFRKVANSIKFCRVSKENLLLKKARRHFGGIRSFEIE